GGSFSFSEKDKIDSTFYNYLLQEQSILSSFLLNQLKRKKSLGEFSNRIINKLTVIEEAVNCGLDIPETIISSDKNIISDFLEKNIKVITKSISENFQHISEKEFYDGKVRQLCKEGLKGIGREFFPSLIQEQIEKAYELRIFFIKEKFYSMAIFSQNDEKQVWIIEIIIIISLTGWFLINCLMK
ncbi:MAG: hypothetical protein HC831_27915, partial [Chloroflexia bacterium]|nr:hypothetical protein [Chloroflexia bacterium]